MKKSSLLLRACALLVLTASATSIAEAQNREKHGISAKAGGVNSVTGRVMVARAGQAQQLLTSQDDLAAGDVVATSAASQAEVLLNPGAYLRLAENSELQLADNSLDNLRVRLIKGNAIIEATGADDTELRIGIVTDQVKFSIVRRGVYRINVEPGLTELLVRKGRVLIGDGPPEMVKSGSRVTFRSGSPLIAKLGKERDEFDKWSKDRAEFLARANQKLSIRTLNSYLFSWNWDWGFSAANGYGLWTYSPFARCFTFFPFRYGWGSPYGGNYDRNGWLSYDYGCCNSGNFDPVCCRGRVNPPIIVSNPSGSSGGFYGGSSGGSSGGSGGSSGGFGNSGGSSSGGNREPSSPRPPSQAGPRDPDSGGRSINRIKDPIN